jgi:hypothetical protein
MAEKCKYGEGDMSTWLDRANAANGSPDIFEMEAAIADLVHMARISHDQSQAIIDGLSFKNDKAQITSDDVETVLFAVEHLRQMIDALQAKFAKYQEANRWGGTDTLIAGNEVGIIPASASECARASRIFSRSTP